MVREGGGEEEEGEGEEEGSDAASSKKLGKPSVKTYSRHGGSDPHSKEAESAELL